MQWSAVPHEDKVKTEWSALCKGQLPHALLWVGPEGIGKTAAAWMVTKALLCQESDSIDPCGRCQNCQLMDRIEHPNLLFIPPLPNDIPIEEGVQTLRIHLRENPFLSLSEWEAILAGLRSKPSENKSALVSPKGISGRVNLSIGVEAARRLQSALSLSIPKDSWRIVWFWHAEMLTRQAANALLKVVEEPPAQTIFIFTSARLETLPVTLRSRCHIWRFPPLSKDKIEALAGESVGNLRYFLSQGSYNRFQRLKEPSFESYIQALQGWLRSLSQENNDPAPYIEELLKAPQLSEILSMGAILIREHPKLTPLQKAIGMDTLLRIADEIELNLQPAILLWEATLYLRRRWQHPQFEWEWISA